LGKGKRQDLTPQPCGLFIIDGAKAYSQGRDIKKRAPTKAEKKHRRTWCEGLMQCHSDLTLGLLTL